MQRMIENDNTTIQFQSRKLEDEGFYALLISKIPIKSAGQHKYIINSKGLKLLKSKGIKYELVH